MELRVGGLESLVAFSGKSVNMIYRTIVSNLTKNQYKILCIQQNLMNSEDHQKFEQLWPRLDQEFRTENERSALCRDREEDQKTMYPACLKIIEQEQILNLDFYYFNDMKIKSYRIKHLSGEKNWDQETTYMVGRFFEPPVKFLWDMIDVRIEVSSQLPTNAMVTLYSQKSKKYIGFFFGYGMKLMGQRKPFTEQFEKAHHCSNHQNKELGMNDNSNDRTRAESVLNSFGSKNLLCTYVSGKLQRGANLQIKLFNQQGNSKEFKISTNLNFDLPADINEDRCRIYGGFIAPLEHLPKNLSFYIFPVQFCTPENQRLAIIFRHKKGTGEAEQETIGFIGTYFVFPKLILQDNGEAVLH